MKFQLIDEICTQDWSNSSGFAPEVKEIAGAQVLCIDNVDHFFWENFDRNRDIGGFPNYAPPFENYFMYCDETAMVTSDGKPYRDAFPQYRYGFWFIAMPVENATSRWAIDWFTENNTNRLILKQSGVKWRMIAVHFTSYSKGSVAANVWYQYLVNEDGSTSDLGLDSACDANVVMRFAKHYGRSQESIHDELLNLSTVNLAACYLATSLLHCKNVTAIDAVPTAKERYRMDGYERTAKQPAAKWKVLTIEPMVRTLRTQGAIERNGLSKALHICRGHFKDFSQGKGLFGKNKGLYWWDQHMRGDEDAGIVIKDYNIKSPSGD